MQQQGKFILFNRNEFKDWLMKTNFTRQIKTLQNHHTAEPNYDDFNGRNHFELLNSMEYFHIHTDKFSQIAQNVTIFPDGLIAICRDFNIAPAGIKGCNTYGLCMENVGNFDINQDKMTDEHKDSILFVNAILCIKFKLTPNTSNSITYHHWWELEQGYRFTDTQINNNQETDVKTCPGTDWFSGNKVIDAQKNFIPLIICKMNEIVKGDVKPVDNNIPSWKQDTVNWMKEVGILTSDHSPIEQIDMGTLGAMLKNFVNVYKLTK